MTESALPATADRPNGGQVILPGAVLGVFGSGQLGRMFALAARTMGYRVATYSDDRSASPTPTGQIADQDVVADYDHPTMVPLFARGVAAATVEFENVPVATLRRVAESGIPVRPGPEVLGVAQHRAREKRLFGSVGLETVAWSDRPLREAVEAIGFPAIAKSATLGYDGRGQWALEGPGDLALVPDGVELVVEERVALAAECSVVVARGHSGEVATFPVIRNHHEQGILDWSMTPSGLPPAVLARATEAARAVAEALDLVGVACLELFVTADGRVLANELAPRPHNSGHLTIEAAATSQFEQQVRALCGLPLGTTDLHRPAAMVNLLGDLWVAGTPDWAAALALPGVRLHLYGKAEPRPGRKMGHLTVMADTASDARDLACEARRRLTRHQESAA